jgi:hypothetical protein
VQAGKQRKHSKIELSINSRIQKNQTLAGNMKKRKLREKKERKKKTNAKYSAGDDG